MRENGPDRELLSQLAHACGVETEYWSYDGNLTSVADHTLIAVLAAMGIDATTEDKARAALADVDMQPWHNVLPECTVIRRDTEGAVAVHVPDGASVTLTAVLEDGGQRALTQRDDYVPPRYVDGTLIGRASFTLPANLPLGYHTLRASVITSAAVESVEYDAPLIVVPQRLRLPSERGASGWGIMAQLYSTRSRDSWGVGDTADLKEMCSFFGASGGDFILINPLHAAEPVGHMSPSPYLPVTRRFFNPIYIRPEDIREVAYMPAAQRALVHWAAEKPKAASLRNENIDRDSVWESKRRALEVIFNFGRSDARQRAFERFRAEEGQGLEDFAFWCALREKYGEQFPENLARPDSAYAANERRELAERIDFYAWLQWIIDAQLEDAQRSACSAGMALGIFHDLAVGVHPHGSDVWSIPEAFAEGVGVGAPPDMYNQQGQNWSQPPWRPDSLRRMAYAPLRDMARTVLRHAGALRVDHVMGLFRLWWIPDGECPSGGTYVRFDHEAMVGVLMLEAARAGAVVVGEDLGNVEPWVRDYLRERGILGTSVMLFEQENGYFKEPGAYRREALVTVDTHDLPPAAGYLAGEHVDLRESLGLLTEPVEKVRSDAAEERRRLMDRLRQQGLIGDDPTEREVVEALHRFIARAPAELLGVALVDAVGERRAQNQPGTDQEYPNWRIPLADGSEQVVLVEDLPNNPRLQSLLAAFTAELRAARQ